LPPGAAAVCEAEWAGRLAIAADRSDAVEALWRLRAARRPPPAGSAGGVEGWLGYPQ